MSAQAGSLPPVRLKRLPGLTPYESALEAMRAFTDTRTPATPDEIWLLEHPPVYTLGLNADPAHVLQADGVPVVRTDRGGQVTFHGPGQLVVYVLVDLARARLGVRSLVCALEQAVVDLAADAGIEAVARRDAPGVYVAGAKLASLGLRVRRHSTYHGLSLNVDLDLEPFGRINPCGFPDLVVTRLRDLGVSAPLDEVADDLGRRLLAWGRREAGWQLP